MPMSSGGIFQLIAYGAQDYWLSGNNEITLFQAGPRSLQEYCLEQLSPRDKTYIISECAEQFPEYIETYFKEKRLEFYVQVLSEIHDELWSNSKWEKIRNSF